MSHHFQPSLSDSLTIIGRYRDEISDDATGIANRAFPRYSVFWLYNKVEVFGDGGRDHSKLDGVM